MVANSGYVDVDVDVEQFSYVGLLVGLHALEPHVEQWFCKRQGFCTIPLCIEQCNLFVVSVNYMNM